jgi:hypothetical protein
MTNRLDQVEERVSGNKNKLEKVLHSEAIKKERKKKKNHDHDI